MAPWRKQDARESKKICNYILAMNMDAFRLLFGSQHESE